MNSDNLFGKGLKYEIYIGIKDKDTYEEILDVNDFKSILSDICTEKQISFSLIIQHGGYPHNKGYTTETSLRVSIIGISEDEILRLSERLKKEINTDTVLITKTEIEFCFV